MQAIRSWLGRVHALGFTEDFVRFFADHVHYQIPMIIFHHIIHIIS